MLLAIDTATNQIGLACYDTRGLLAECLWDSARNHTAQLLPQLTLLLDHLGYEPSAITALGVALGPGSWSGLRVGLSIAKGLVLAHDIPAVGVSTLDALAYQSGNVGLPVIPLIRLGRERFATLDRQLQEPISTTLEALAAQIEGHVHFCGDVDSEVRKVLHSLLGERAHFSSPAAAARRPGYLAELAWQRLQRGTIDDIATLEPMYLGQPVRLPT